MRRSGEEGEPARTEDFENFYRAHYLRVRKFVARRVLAHDVDDVLVDTFAVAARRFDELPAEPSRQVGWLLVTARNRIGNLRRSIRRSRALTDRFRSLAPTRTPEHETMVRCDGMADSAIQRAFDQLSDDDRTILQLVAWDECSPDELAEIFGCSPGAAKTRLSRAKSRFRMAVEGGVGGG